MKELKADNRTGHSYTHEYLVQSSRSHKNQKVETTQVFTDRWVNRKWWTHKWNITLPSKREVLTPAPAGMNPEDVLWSQSSPSRNDKYWRIPLTRGT